MFGAQYYHGLIRKYVIAFGNLFNDLVIQRLDKEGNRIQSIGVPLAYGPKEKFLQRLTQDPNLDSQVAITLPRMGFEITAFTYAPTRKLSSTHRHWAGINGVTDQLKSTYVPVPYDISFTLSIFVANADDGAQLLEQIVPYFKPEYTTNVILIPDMGISVDTPIVLQDISLQDTYEGEYQTRRALTFDLNFTCKGYLFGPTQDEKLITQAIVNYYDGLPPDDTFLQRLTYYSNGAILETATGDLETIDYDGIPESGVAQNLWYVIRGDTGEATAYTPTSVLKIVGGTNIETAVTEGDKLTINYTGQNGAGEISISPDPKSTSIYEPTDSENAFLFFADKQYIINSIKSVMRNTGTSSVDFSVQYGEDVSGGGTQIVAGGITCTSNTVANTVFPTSSVIPANNMVWLTTSGVTGLVDQFHVSILFNEEIRNSEIDGGRSLTLLYPTIYENVILFYTDKNLVLTSIDSVMRTTGPSSMEFTIKYGDDVSASGTEIILGGTTCTSNTTPNSVTAFNNGIIPANNFIWVETTGVTGSVQQLHVTISY